MSSSNETILRVDYYVGAFGPTIRMGAHSQGTVVRMRDLLLDLTEARVTDVELRELPFTVLNHIGGLRLLRVLTRRQWEKALRRTGSADNGPVFIWSDTNDGWKDNADLLQAIIQHGRAGHQYLTREGIDDALVEFAFLENNELKTG